MEEVQRVHKLLDYFLVVVQDPNQHQQLQKNMMAQLGQQVGL